MTAHTPGPWKINTNCQPAEYPEWFEVVSEYNAKYRRMVVNGHCGEANARLIAAAPDLLEALRDMVSDHASLSEATLAFARAAIAKAVGHE